jgi:hypothetical protein
MHASPHAAPGAAQPPRLGALPPQRPWRWLREHLPDLGAAFIGLLLALPILLPQRLVLPGLRGADAEAVLRTLELTLALRAGHWPPRWMPDALYGLGYPFWNFHGPLPYLGGALIGLGQAGLTAIQEALPEFLRPGGAGGASADPANLVAGTRVALALWLLLAALGASRLVRPWSRQRGAGLLAALLLPAACLLIASLEGPGAAPTRLAQAALLPWALAAMLSAVRAPGLGPALRWAGLLALLLCCEPRPDRPWLSGALIVLGLAAWAWRHREQGATEAPDRPVPAATRGDRGPWAWLGPARLRRRLAEVELRRGPRRLMPRRAALAALAGGAALGLALSAWLWLPSGIERSALGRALPGAVMGGGAQALANEGPDRADLTLYESLTGRLATLSDAPLPAAVHQRPAGGPATALGHQGNPRLISGVTQLERVTPGLRDPARRDWRLVISGNRRSTLAFPILWFPGWEAQVNGGRPRATSAVEGSGWLKLTLEPDACANDCSIVLRLGRSPVRAAAEILSLLALLLWLALWLTDRRRLLLRGGLTLLAALALAALAAWLLPRPDRAEPALFAWLPRSGAALPADQAPGLDWAGSATTVGHGASVPRLIDAVMSSPAARGEPPSPRDARRDTLPVDAGDTLELRLRWKRPPKDLEVTAQLVMASAPVLHWPDTVAEASAKVEAGGSALLSLSLPETTIPGLYLVRLGAQAAGAALRPTTAGGDEAVFLGPVRVRRLPERLPATEGNLAQLGDLSVLAMAAEDPVSSVPWTADHPAAKAAPATDPAATLKRRLPVRITWKAARLLALDHGRTLRLLDAAGKVVAALEGAPFGGGYPTSAWPAGEPVTERVWLPLPAKTSGDHFRLELELLDGLSGDSLGSAEVRDLTLRP